MKTLPVSALALLALNQGMAGTSLAAVTEKHDIATMPSSSTVTVPPECTLKAQALASSASLAQADRLASEALIMVLSDLSSSLQINYTLQPELVRRGENGTVSEIRLLGSFSNLSVNLIDITGQSYASTVAFNSLGVAQATASLANTAEQLVQVNSNQATLNLDVQANSIKTMDARLGLRSDYQNRATLELAIASGGVQPGSTTTLVQGRAITLADLVTTIEIDARVSFNSKRMLVSNVNTRIGC